MRNTRYIYHKAVKDIKRNDLNARKAKLAEMANESDGRALWDELKRLNRGVKCTTNTLDGHNTNADIVEHLATKYRALFSSQTTTEAKLNDIRHVIQDKVPCAGNAFVVTVTEVCEMTSKLKINKSDGLTGSCSDHFVYAPHRFAVLFTMLINVMLVHGYMPDDMLASVLVSIPKDPTGSLTNSRPLTHHAQQLVSSVPPQETVKHWTHARWAESWASTTTRLHKFIPTPSNSGQGVGLSRRAWTRLNRLRTGVGRFGANMLRWGLSTNDSCACGAEQTADHITSPVDVAPSTDHLRGSMASLFWTMRREHGSRTMLWTYEWCVMAHARTTRSANYREIALFSSMGKIVDMLISVQQSAYDIKCTICF